MIDPKEELEPGILQNMSVVVELLRQHFPIHESTAYRGKRDYECVSLEWPNRNIFCLIYSDSVVLDHVRLIAGTQRCIHDEEEILIGDLKERFIPIFTNKYSS